MEINSLNINKPIIIELLDDNEEWKEYYKCRAHVQFIGGNENISSGAEQSNTETLFAIRYCKKASQIEFDTQSYRIRFNGAIFDLTSCDNDGYRNVLIVMKGKGQRERN
jgi:SPP1 family predicted phage head-tail adaptor|uniref:Putative head tail adaptor n=1 Tax=Siphoviridae sp. ctGuJ10 TaxID=2825418 RepID=A0A8S5PUE9_9CAUD|nr:MAG TPA: putative head tail adaptor [Siphoviridae sp. ctGuJ10]